MELLFTNYRKSVYTEVYANGNGELFCKYYKHTGELVEFIVPDTDNIREHLRKGYISAVRQRRGDFNGAVAEEVYKIYIDNRHIAKMIYGEFYGETTAKIYLVKQGAPMDYRKENLTLNFKDMTFSKDVLENRKAFVDRTLTAHKDIDREKRLNSSYSNKLSELQTKATRERSKLDLDMVQEIRELYTNGATQKELCELYDISRPTLGDILLYRTWNIYEYMEEDIAPVALHILPEVPYHVYADEPTHLRVDNTLKLFSCAGFVYKIQQKVDFQVYISKHLPTGEIVSDVHLTYTDNPRGTNKYRNYIISAVRGNRLANYYMSKQDVYSIVHSYTQYI